MALHGTHTTAPAPLPHGTTIRDIANDFAMDATVAAGWGPHAVTEPQADAWCDAIRSALEAVVYATTGRGPDDLATADDEVRMNDLLVAVNRTRAL